MRTPSTSPRAGAIAAADDDARAGLESRSVLGVRVDATSYSDATERIIRWGQGQQSRHVCVATVNDLIEARDEPGYLDILNEADLVTPDGMPLVWSLRALGVPTATRVYGPDLTPDVCARAERDGVAVGFYGGSEQVLSILIERLQRRFPALHIAYAWAPPFRALTPEEDAAVVREVNTSGARVLFVGLGAPKQGRWIADHVDELKTVMIGVGAAFDFLAGAKKQAPSWVQAIGMEWAYRLIHEPRRLWKRYLLRNPRFVWLLMTQLITERLGRDPQSSAPKVASN